MNELEKKVLQFLKDNAVGEVNAVRSNLLQRKFELTGREVRLIITSLRKNAEVKEVIGSSVNGYFIAQVGEDANYMLFKRIYGSIDTIVKNSGAGALKPLYSFLNQYKRFDENKPNHNQINMYEKGE